MAYQTLTVSHEDRTATITLNRPEKRNAVSFQLVEDLIGALGTIDKSDSQVVIITGAGKAFCAGLDLEELKSLIGKSHEQNLKDSATMANLFRTIYDFPKPTIAAVNGAAIAGGTGIATMCDFTLAVPEAKVGYTEVKIGFLPAIVSVFLLRQIGEKRTRDLLLTGRILEPAEAKEIGLINEIVPAEKLMERAKELADILIAASPGSVTRAKRLLTSAAAAGVDADLERAILENARIRCTPDFKEGLASFLEKRKPVWRGDSD